MSIKQTVWVRRTFALTTFAAFGTWVEQAPHGQDMDLRLAGPPGAQVMADAMTDGAFLPLSMHTGNASHGSAMVAWGGYTSDRDRAILDARAEVALLPWLVLQARTATDPESTGVRPSVGLRLRLIGESGARPGIALGAFYKTEGFTEPEGEMEGLLAFSAHLGRLGLLANLVYGQDADGRERDGEVGAAVTIGLGQRWLLGLDSRARLNLAPNAAAQPGKQPLPHFDLVAGPLAMCRLGPAFLAAQAGIAMIELAGLRSGVFVMVGFGAAFR